MLGHLLQRPRQTVTPVLTTHSARYVDTLGAIDKIRNHQRRVIGVGLEEFLKQKFVFEDFLNARLSPED